MSRPTELPRQPLSEPYLNLSIYTAPIKQSFYTFVISNISSQYVWLNIQFDHLTQPLCSTIITIVSTLLRVDPPQCLTSVLSSLWDSHLDFSLVIKTTGSRSSARKPRLGSRHLYAEHHLPRIQIPGKFIPKKRGVLGFDVNYITLRRVSSDSLVLVFLIYTSPVLD